MTQAVKPAATITVTVAPGCHITEPHHSGIKELPGRVLKGGDTLQVSPETAGDLAKARLILDPNTGAVIKEPEPLPGQPRPYVPSPGPTIQFGDGRAIPMVSGVVYQPPPVETPFNPPEPKRPLSPEGTLRPVATVHYWEGPQTDPNGSGIATVTQVDGRNWPSW